MAKFNIKTVKPKFVVTTAPETKIDVSINRPIITAKNQKAYFKLKNTGGPKGDKGDTGDAATITVGSTSTGAPGTNASVTNSGTSSAAVLDFTIPRGDKGDKGDTGATGSPGAAATISVGTTTTGQPGTNASVTNVGTSSAAVLNFTIPRGAKGDTGATGATGATGSPGAAATVAVGTTTTGNPGTNASVTNSGTQSAAVLNFTIPRGAKGDTGDSATITVDTTTTGQPGTDASVTNSGTQSAAVLNFTIPRGDKGDQGDPGTPGSPGTAATIAVGTTTTGNPGTNASVTNSGTSSAAVFNFTIPKGAKGDPGDPGTPGSAATIAVGSTQTGNPGTSASVVNSGTSSAAVLDFTIPRGDKGDQGNPGSAATVAVGTVTTGLPGTSATVTNVGTSSAAVFDFTIPRGDKGEAGSGSGDMLAADYDPNGTVQDAGGIVNYVGSVMPTVNDATLTIQRNGTNVQTFTANASSNVTANISVPTKTSDLTNDGSDNTAQYLETDETAYRTTSIPYGECNNTSTATAFTATVPGITELRDGVCMLLKNGVVTSASGFTINVNGLGAKPAYSNMAAATRETTAFNINYTIMFVYDSDRVEGGCWVYYRGYYSDSNSVGYQLRTNSSTLPAKEKGYRYRLWLTSADGQNYVPINKATGTSTTSTKALNTTTPIDPFGTIVYNSTNDTVNADANLPNGTQWTQYVLDMRYQKYPLTLTFPDPVYLQCTPQSTGGALINDIVQALPSTEDGKIYIYLGNAYSATNMELKQNHPVYYFKDGAVRFWTNDAASISSVAWGDITGTLSDQTDLNTALGAKANSADLATVATSGSYNDLSNKPTIPAAQVNSDWSANSGVAQILNKPTLATVATSGSYNDLSNKPTIPTVNNATLTIQKNGTTVKTFTANASSNVTANITVPTATSDLTNDSGFIDEVSTITNARIDEIMGVA